MNRKIYHGYSKLLNNCMEKLKMKRKLSNFSFLFFYISTNRNLSSISYPLRTPPNRVWAIKWTHNKDHNTSAFSGSLWAALWDKVEGNKSTCLDSCISHPKLPLHCNHKKSNTYKTDSLHLCVHWYVSTSYRFSEIWRYQKCSRAQSVLYIVIHYCNKIFEQRMITFLAGLIFELALLNVSGQRQHK